MLEIQGAQNPGLTKSFAELTDLACFLNTNVAFTVTFTRQYYLERLTKVH